MAKALEKYIYHGCSMFPMPHLIVDDVLTTGGSMERAKKAYLGKNFSGAVVEGHGVNGAVIFARGRCPDWIKPVFQMPKQLWISGGDLEFTSEAVKHAEKIQAQNLKSGDIFCFRNRFFVCLCNFTDTRHTQSIITCNEYPIQKYQQVTCIRFFRTFHVPVLGNAPQNLEVMDNSKEEISSEEIKQLEIILRSTLGSY